MKKLQKILLLAAAFCAILCLSVFAAEEQRSLAAGFYDIGSAANVSIEARLADNTKATVVTAAVGEDTAIYHESAVRLSVTYSGPANEGDYFNVLLVTGSGLPTSSNTLCYINQAAKGEGDIVFDVYPLLPAQTTDLTLYITSKSDGFTTIAIPLCYAVANTYKLAPFIPGDANNDMTININDALAIINHIVGKIPLEGNDLLAADANKDGRVNINDAMQVINQVVELT